MYKILSSSDFNDLEKQVNEHIKHYYVPIGGLTTGVYEEKDGYGGIMRMTFFYQAIYKTKTVPLTHTGVRIL